MGINFSVCCNNKYLLDHEERLHPISSLNPLLYIPKQDKTKEHLDTYQFTYSNIVKYLTTTYEIKFGSKSSQVNKLAPYNFSTESLQNAQQIEDSAILIINNKENSSKLILKCMKFNYDDSKILTPQEIKSKYPLQYHLNRNLFKELRILRNHDNPLFVKCKGYHIDEQTSQIYLVYDCHENSLCSMIKNKLLDFKSRIRIMKTLIELLKALHTEGIISLDISVSSIRFTAEKFHTKLIKFVNSFDMKSGIDIDRNSKIEINKIEIHQSPELVLKQIEKINWNCDVWSLGVIFSMLFSNSIHNISPDQLFELYKDGRIPEMFYEKIDNIYLKSIVIGMLRIDPSERPNVFEIIDVYNNLIEHLGYEKEYVITYDKEDVLAFTAIFQKSTYVILSDETTRTLNRQIPDANKIEENKSQQFILKTVNA